MNDQLLRARQEAVRRARATGQQQRIYVAFGQHHIRAADTPYEGWHVEFVSSHACTLPEDVAHA